MAGITVTMSSNNPEQLTVIGRITALKDMGFTLADIVKIIGLLCGEIIRKQV